MPGWKSGFYFNGVRGLGWEEISELMANLWKISKVVPIKGCLFRLGGQLSQVTHGEYFSRIGLKAASRLTQCFAAPWQYQSITLVK